MRVAAMHATGTATGRFTWLDNLKVVLVAGVIVAHAAMTYGAAGTWVFETGEHGGPTLGAAAEIALSALIAVGVMFAMGLFMLVSGLLTPPAAARRGAGAFAGGRLVRLGIPILAYVLVVMPLLGVLIDATAGAANASFPTLYRTRLEHLTTGPLWFVVILLAISLGYVAWRSIVPARPDRVGRTFGDRDLAVAAAVIAVASFAVRVIWRFDSGQYLDAHVWLWPQCAVLFAIGAGSAERGAAEVAPVTVRRRWARAALVALGVTALILGTLASDEDAALGGLHWESLVLASFEAVFSIGASLWLLAWFATHARHQGRLGRELARAAYGAFILQAPVLVALGLALHEVRVPAELGFVLLSVGGVALSFLGAWVGILATRGRAPATSTLSPGTSPIASTGPSS